MREKCWSFRRENSNESHFAAFLCLLFLIISCRKWDKEEENDSQILINFSVGNSFSLILQCRNLNSPEFPPLTKINACCWVCPDQLHHQRAMSEQTAEQWHESRRSKQVCCLFNRVRSMWRWQRLKNNEEKFVAGSDTFGIASCSWPRLGNHKHNLW